DRVDERFRPVGLEELERQANRDRQPKSVVADGGDQEYDEGER
ncbi:zinc ribbon domain-containing protein, partial [Halorubrum sp. SS7]